MVERIHHIDSSKIHSIQHKFEEVKEDAAHYWLKTDFSFNVCTCYCINIIFVSLSPLNLKY